jgi:hypothetical protein
MIRASLRRYCRQIGIKTLGALLLGLAGSFSIHANDNDVVWVWNSQCQTPITVPLRVRLDGKTVYATSLPLCRWARRFENGKARFRFTPGRPLIWYGYRSDEGDGRKDQGDPTAPGTTLTIDFWQAGGESDVIELGYSVEATDRLHMNSIHLLSPTTASTTTMAPGLILETLPEIKP